MAKNEWPEEWSPKPTRKGYPGRKCREAIWQDMVVHGCDVAVDSLSMAHDGPCASQSVLASIQRRTAWENSKKEEE